MTSKSRWQVHKEPHRGVAHLCDAAGVEHNDLVGSLHRRQPVCDDQHCPARYQALDCLHTE